MGFSLLGLARGASTLGRNLEAKREKEEQKQILLEDRLRQQKAQEAAVQRQTSLDELLRARQTAQDARQARMDEAATGSRSLDDELKRTQIAAAQHPAQRAPVPGTAEYYAMREKEAQIAAKYRPAPKQGGPKPVPPSDKDRTADFMREGAERAERTLRGYAASPRTWVNSVPGLGNYGQTETDQVAQQAAETLHDAYLRITTGSTIGKDEMTRAAKQYIAQPGDGPRVLRAKAERRAEILRAIRASSDRVRGGIASDPDDEIEAGLPNP